MSRRAPTPVIDNISCFEAIRDLGPVLDVVSRGYGQAYLLGGIVTSALNHEGTVYDEPSTTVKVSPDLLDSSAAPRIYRANGTLSDVDILVHAVLSKEDKDAVKQDARDAVKDQMKISIHTASERPQRVTNAQRVAGLMSEWTSSRTIDDDGIYRYELFPLEQIVGRDSYVPWRMEFDGHTVPVFHPAGHMLAYAMRSSSGIRHKDEAKYALMRERVGNRFRDEIEDGPFNCWKRFGDCIEEVFNYGRHAGLSYQPNATQGILAAAKLRGQTLARLEASDRFVKWAQSSLQPILDRIIHAA